jgi:predicted amidohydrolase YtcJ
MEMIIRTVDLNETKSIKEAQNEIMGKLSQTKKGEWVLGRGWDISKWDLGPFSPDHLIVLTRVCGHMITLNS